MENIDKLLKGKIPNKEELKRMLKMAKKGGAYSGTATFRSPSVSINLKPLKK